MMRGTLPIIQTLQQAPNVNYQGSSVPYRDPSKGFTDYSSQMASAAAMGKRPGIMGQPQVQANQPLDITPKLDSSFDLGKFLFGQK